MLLLRRVLLCRVPPRRVKAAPGRGPTHLLGQVTGAVGDGAAAAGPRDGVHHARAVDGVHEGRLPRPG